jgi:hypothetical protein
MSRIVTVIEKAFIEQFLVIEKDSPCNTDVAKSLKGIV